MTLEDKAKTVVDCLKMRYDVKNGMQVTASNLVECTKDGKHLNLDKLLELYESKNKADNFKFINDIAGIDNFINHETHSLNPGYDPNCGWEA